MPQSTTVAMIRAISKTVHAALKSAGFKRNSPHLVRESEDVLHVIHFQASRWGSMAEGKFTVNLVVASAAIYEAWTGSPLPSNPASAAFPVQQRIGQLLPSNRDLWWSVDPSTATQDLGNDIAAILSEYALPFFERFRNSEALLKNLNKDRGLPGLTRPQAALIHAFLLHRNGEVSEAQAVVEEEWASAEGSPFRHTIASFAKRSGIEASGVA